jgi:hypothetical protein
MSTAGQRKQGALGSTCAAVAGGGMADDLPTTIALSNKTPTTQRTLMVYLRSDEKRSEGL